MSKVPGHLRRHHFFVSIALSSLLGTLIPGGPASAQPRGAAVAAVGGAGVAWAPAEFSGMLNPALLPLGASGFSGALFAGEAPLDFERSHTEASRHYGLSASDNSKDIVLPGYAAAYQRHLKHAGQDWTQQVFQLALANWMAMDWSGGFSIKYLKASSNRGRQESDGAFSLGGVYAGYSGWRLALVWNSLLRWNKDVPSELSQPPEVIFGLSWELNEGAQVVADLAYQLDGTRDPLSLRFGIANHIFPLWVVRLGLERLGPETVTRPTLGFGFDGPRLKVDYALSVPLEDQGLGMHSVDLRLSFW